MPTTGKTAATSLKLEDLNYSVSFIDDNSVRILLFLSLSFFYFILSLFTFFRGKVEMARTEAYDRKAFDAWIYLFGGKSDLFPIVMRDFVDCATFIVHLPFLFQQINIGSEMDGRTFIERETCYWSLNATIEIPPAYMSNHRFRVLKNIIYEIRMKRSIFRSILSIASFSIIFLFGKENEKRLFYFVHYLLVPERISISSQNEILFQ